MGKEETHQRAVCKRHRAAFTPPVAGTRLGIALQTLDRRPLHGLRINPDPGTCGWFIWAGEESSEAADFYQPLCVEHLPHRCPLVLPFLALPPGWRFLTDGEYVDVWYDPDLIDLHRPR